MKARHPGQRGALTLAFNHHRPPFGVSTYSFCDRLLYRRHDGLCPSDVVTVASPDSSISLPTLLHLPFFIHRRLPRMPGRAVVSIVPFGGSLPAGTAHDIDVDRRNNIRK